MNQVHEQCPKFDSGTVLSQTESKTGRVHQVHSLLAQQHAQAARRAPRSCAPHTCLPRAPRAPACAVRQRPAPARPTPKRAQRLRASACAQRLPSAPTCTPSLYCDTNCLPRALFTTIHQSVLQYSAHQPSTRSQYNKVHCNTVSSAASCLYCNTLDPSHTFSLAIQSTSLAHPRPLYHNTMPFLQYNWAVAQIIFCTKFIIIICFFVSSFFFFISSYWKIKNIYIHAPFFFSFSIILK